MKKTICISLGLVLLSLGIILTPKVGHNPQREQEQREQKEQKGQKGQKGSDTALLSNPAEIVDIIDADTVVINQGDKIYRVRLMGIDAPEINTRLHKESTSFVRTMIDSNAYQMKLIGKDHYNRYLGFVTIEPKTSRNQIKPPRKDLGLMLLEKGYAKTSSLQNLTKEKQKEYRKAQKTAKEKKLGIWNKSF